jgi:hypothetical protein
METSITVSFNEMHGFYYKYKASLSATISYCITAEPVFVNHLRSPEIDSQPCGIPGLRKRLTNTGSELEFLKSLWGLGNEEEEGYRTGPPGYIVWRNSFLGIDSGAPYTYKNTGSYQSLSLPPLWGGFVFVDFIFIHLF